MKIAVYTIALNEEKFIERWYESAKDADYLLIADTGSTDKTVKLAKKLGINIIKISINPWRFDDARNAALAALPADIDMCISLDLDEVLSDGWREAIEKTTATQIMYRYTYSWNNKDQTLPGSITSQAKVHARHGYRWKYMVHEYIFPDRNPNHSIDECGDFSIIHYPDNEKSRDSYNKLIKEQLEEDPTSDRYQIYYAKSLLSQEKIDEAIKEFKKFIAMEKLTTQPTYVSSSYITLSFLEPKKKLKHLKAALKAWYSRESLISIAIYYFNKGNWRTAKKYCKKTLEITQRTTDPNYLEYAWGYLPKNMLYVCNHNLNFKNRNHKMSLNVGSLTSTNFDLFKETDVV
jgi:glycosyltransferase involved in cell wall biosynthesis